MSTGLLPIIKQASLDVWKELKTADLVYGKVVQTNPLAVQVTNQFTIPESCLVVPEHLQDMSYQCNVEWTISETSLSSVSIEGTTHTHDPHTHELEGTTFITLNNALEVGERVAMLRKQGGQSYFILDRY